MARVVVMDIVTDSASTLVQCYCNVQSEFLSQMGVSLKAASWWSLAAASGAAAVLAILAGYAVQRFRIRQEMHEEIHEIM